MEVGPHPLSLMVKPHPLFLAVKPHLLIPRDEVISLIPDDEAKFFEENVISMRQSNLEKGDMSSFGNGK